MSPSTAVDCGDLRAHGAADFDPGTNAERQELERVMEDLVATCEANSGPVLEFLDSYSTARDMDQIRRALGEETITYAGASYGTVLGTVYADLFPGNLRGILLEANVRPNLDGASYLAEQAVRRERAFEALVADCRARPECAARFPGGDMGAAYDRAIRQVAAAPIIDPATGGTINQSHVLDALTGLMEASSPWIEQLIEAVEAGDWPLAGYLPAKLGPSSTFAPMVATRCLDLDLPEPEETYEQLLPGLLETAPRFGLSNLPGFLPCAHWSTEPPDYPPPRATGTPPILVIGNTGDLNTPHAWSEEVATQLSGVLLTYDGPGHLWFWQQPANQPGFTCVTDAAIAYLLDLTLPPEGTVCPGP